MYTSTSPVTISDGCHASSINPSLPCINPPVFLSTMEDRLLLAPSPALRRGDRPGGPNGKPPRPIGCSQQPTTLGPLALASWSADPLPPGVERELPGNWALSTQPSGCDAISPVQTLFPQYRGAVKIAVPRPRTSWAGRGQHAGDYRSGAEPPWLPRVGQCVLSLALILVRILLNPLFGPPASLPPLDWADQPARTSCARKEQSENQGHNE